MSPFMQTNGQDFAHSVFVNCPFDAEYEALLRPLLFSVLALGYRPRIASESSDSGEVRLSKICSLIGCSQYAIHDLSRLQAAKLGEYYRLNMPFELGIDYGCRTFGESRHRNKRFLVLAGQPYEYRRAVSDLAGVDIKYHKEKPSDLVRCVRNWFVETVGVRRAPSATKIWYSFNDFMADFRDKRESEGFADDDLEMMPIPELLDFMAEWLSDN